MVQWLRELKSEKNETHSLINKWLPPEILSAIFVDCLATLEELDYCCKHEHWVNFSPLQLGNVCCHWHDITWSMPSLWCQLSLTLYSDQLGERASLLADLTCKWLDRSGSLPLSLYVLMKSNDNTFYNNQSNFTIQHPVIKIVKMYLQWWQDLYLWMWVPCVSQMGTDIMEIPILQTLKLWPMGNAYQWLWKDAKMRPQLFDLHLHELVPSTPSLILEFFRNIDWKNINNIAVDSLPWGDYIQILKSASQLTRFTINNFWSRSPFAASGQVLHPKLQYFKICGKIKVFAHHTPEYFKNFIALLNFPSLKELDYNVGWFSGPSQSSKCHFPETFLKHIEDLEKLSIQLSDSSESCRYINLLKKWPSLNYFFLIDRNLFIRGWSSSESYCKTLDDNLSLLCHLSAWNNNDQENADPPELFLPAVCTFGYWAHDYEPPWQCILMILGPLSKVSNCYCRPLDAIYQVHWTWIYH